MPKVHLSVVFMACSPHWRDPSPLSSRGPHRAFNGENENGKETGSRNPWNFLWDDREAVLPTPDFFFR
jgi:hypothetical protein